VKKFLPGQYLDTWTQNLTLKSYMRWYYWIKRCIQWTWPKLNNFTFITQIRLLRRVTTILDTLNMPWNMPLICNPSWYMILHYYPFDIKIHYRIIIVLTINCDKLYIYQQQQQEGDSMSKKIKVDTIHPTKANYILYHESQQEQQQLYRVWKTISTLSRLQE